MKVVLRKDVEKLGEKGSVQTVANGFGRNYLIPQGLAVIATEGELKVVAENARVRDLKIARQEKQLQTLSDAISGRRIEFVARSGAGGRLYGSVTSADIAERLSRGRAGDRSPQDRPRRSDPHRGRAYGFGPSGRKVPAAGDRGCERRNGRGRSRAGRA